MPLDIISPYSQFSLDRKREREAREAQERAAQQAARTAKYNGFPNQMAPEQFLEEAYRTYAQDKAKLGSPSYASFPGRTTAPMSTLTQKAREYQDRFAQKRAPFAKKLDTILSKPNEGLPAQHTQELLNRIRQSQTGANENINLEALRNQFRTSFTPERQQAFRGQTEQDINRGLGEFSSRLHDINKAASNLEGTKNNQVAKTFQALQADKQARRQGLIGNLEQFGNQKHAHANKVQASEQAKFRQEAEGPERRLEQLAATLEPIRNRLAGGQLHPDLEQSTAQEIQRALQQYNMGAGRAGSGAYSGNTVAPLSPEMQASYNLLERISPSMKDTYSAQRKDIVRGFLGNETTGTKALQNVPASMQGKVTQLEEDARQRIQKDLAAINNRYTRLGQYGSPQHIGEAERRAQEINRAILEQRNKLTDETLRNQIALQHEGEIGNLRKLNIMGSLGHKEFSDTLGNVRNLNKLGATKWRNEQDELEDLYRNYQNQANYGSHPIYKGGRGEGANDVFGNQEAHGLQLDELANLRAKYSEIEKERNQLQNDIKSTGQAQQAQQQAVQQMPQRAGRLTQQQAAPQQAVQQPQSARNSDYYYIDPNYFKNLISSQLASHPWRNEAPFRSTLAIPRLNTIDQAIANNPGVSPLPFTESQIHTYLDQTYPGFGAQGTGYPFQIPWKKG